jgi:2-polyprenyl-3-methyl-5-hydroxy-6-metoxy-1,4-benzoquinol methylase
MASGLLAKIKRIRAMTPETRRARLTEKWDKWGPGGLALRAAWLCQRAATRRFNLPYQGRTEAGPHNLQSKLARVAAGGAFEQPGICLVNLAAASLVPEGSRVFEVGGGTGYFAFHAARLRGALVVCSEHDATTRAWAEVNRPHPNVTYCNLTLEEARKEVFDVAVAIEVVEHIGSYAAFLHSLSQLAPLAIVTTPNKLRDPFSAVRAVPDYGEHVLEWTAGEFYWVLRSFWESVEISTIPRHARQIEQFNAGALPTPVLAPAGMWEFEEPLVAVCRMPLMVR